MNSSELPSAPHAHGRYLPAVARMGLAMSAGMTPRVEGQLVYVGRVGEEVSVDDAGAAAAIAVSNALSAITHCLGSTETIERCLKLTVYVNAVEGFSAHATVADSASLRLVELLGRRGLAARSAIGVGSLPGNACVEVELTCAVRTESRYESGE